MTVSYLPMFRFLAGCVVAAMVATSVVPCALRGAGGAMTHDCCDTDRPDAVGLAAAPAVAQTPPACCLSSENDPATPATPVIQTNVDLQAVVMAAAPSRFVFPTPSSPVSDRDLRARSTLRSPLIAVLLI